MNRITARRRAALPLVAAAALAMLLSGCNHVTPSASAAPAAGPRSSAASTPQAPAATIEVTPANGSKGARPDEPIVVTASGGHLGHVRVVSADGEELPGDLTGDNSRWESTQRLALGTTYTVTASADNATGQTSTSTATVRTLTPKTNATYYLLPSGGTVGVGMPAIVQFDSTVASSQRAEVEKHITIETSPKVDGAWGWLDGRQLMWRPATFWKPGTKVTLTADLAGVQTGVDKWATRSATTTFSIGSSMISTVDVQRHTLTVRQNGVVIRTIPITTGKKGFETRAGIKVIISRESERQMDAETTGLKKTDPDYYNVKVKYAMRITWSGEFLHAAPWSVASQGHANVSHGCTGMSMANAQWLFERSKVGDVVTYVGSKRPLEEYNGYTVWNMSLAQWKSHSALAG